MRRRQAYATDEVVWETSETQREAMFRKWSSADRTKGKGVCPKCGRYIGRGLSGHMKGCKS